MQGFKHADALTTTPDKKSPTISRLGRNFIFTILTAKRWKAFGADVEDAFLQGVNLEDIGVTIIGIPNSDMRRRLQRLMGLQPGEGLLMLKSRFGDIRAPRLWFDKAEY